MAEDAPDTIAKFGGDSLNITVVINTSNSELHQDTINNASSLEGTVLKVHAVSDVLTALVPTSIVEDQAYGKETDQGVKGSEPKDSTVPAPAVTIAGQPSEKTTDRSVKNAESMDESANGDIVINHLAVSSSVIRVLKHSWDKVAKGASALDYEGIREVMAIQLKRNPTALEIDAIIGSVGGKMLAATVFVTFEQYMCVLHLGPKDDNYSYEMTTSDGKCELVRKKSKGKAAVSAGVAAAVGTVKKTPKPVL